MLPALRVAAGDPTEPGSGAAGHASPPGNGARHVSTVLVVEDDVLIRLDIAGHLRESGYRVLEAANGEEAREILQSKEPIEIVFSDVNLPGAWTGADLATWLRGAFPGVKVILTSGAVTVLDPATACDLFLAKPYHPAEVLAHIRRLLGG
ncbi:MAG TPA: response regulator [Dongiaceae bacterium]|nr:response regulator [Dongiaceae bacterium]